MIDVEKLYQGRCFSQLSDEEKIELLQKHNRDTGYIDSVHTKGKSSFVDLYLDENAYVDMADIAKKNIQDFSCRSVKLVKKRITQKTAIMLIKHLFGGSIRYQDRLMSLQSLTMLQDNVEKRKYTIFPLFSQKINT